ncbi:MAG: hypothetical protein DDT31_01513 [Syntrophomonadaceae bacterium]|nr:hypothetical protein [Bacillota bacterium]MBT9146991.1 hypothetical protein [Bacillota bacterium]
MADKLKYFRIAHTLNKDNEEILISKRLHFRGNINSFSLISLDKDTPERGISQLPTEKSGQKALNEKIDKILEQFRDIKLNDPDKTRPTPEKALQAWIIGYALKHERILPFGDDIEFLTSELAIPKGKKKIVNDILGIDGAGDLVVIELKSNRDKTKLEEQVKNFSDVIAPEESLFTELVKLLTERKWSGGIKKMIVWPCPKTKKNLSPVKWKCGITEICYTYDEEGNPPYSFSKAI